VGAVVGETAPVVSSDDDPPEQAATRKLRETKETPTRNLPPVLRFTRENLPIDQCHVLEFVTLGFLLSVDQKALPLYVIHFFESTGAPSHCQRVFDISLRADLPLAE